MKVFIRTIWRGEDNPLWDNSAQKEALRLYLNDCGFYVLTGAGESLDVFAVEYVGPLDIRLAKKCLNRLAKVWYILTKEIKNEQ